MKEIKLYNVIFPIWLLLFFPPVIFITLIGNFVIDSLVIVICFFVFKLSEKTQVNLQTFYKKSILKVWIFGFLADMIGALILFFLGISGNYFGLSNELISGINYDPFSQPLAILIILCSMLVSGVFLFVFNYAFTYHKQIEDKKLRLKVALTIAIITIPWTFLLPTKWFYHGP